MLPDHVNKITSLVQTTPVFDQAERQEWLTLMELMNDKQLLELEKILNQVPAHPPAQSLHLSHILNAPAVSPAASSRPPVKPSQPGAAAGADVLQKFVKPIAAPPAVAAKGTRGFRSRLAALFSEKELPSGKPQPELELPEHASVVAPAKPVPRLKPQRAEIKPSPPKAPARPVAPPPIELIIRHEIAPQKPQIQTPVKPKPEVVAPVKPEIKLEIKPPVEIKLQEKPALKFPTKPQEVKLPTKPQPAAKAEIKKLVPPPVKPDNLPPVPVPPHKLGGLKMFGSSLKVVQPTPPPASLPVTPSVSKPKQAPAHEPISPPLAVQTGLADAKRLIDAKLAHAHAAPKAGGLDFPGKPIPGRPLVLETQEESLEEMQAGGTQPAKLESLQDVSSLTLASWKNKNYEDLVKGFRKLIAKYGYHEVIFQLEHSSLYSTYIDTGLKILQESISFESLNQPESLLAKKYLSKHEFERFADMLRQMQVG